jgi:hypothetical protein
MDRVGREVPVRCGDIFLSRSNSALGSAIRFFERGRGEDKSVVNHTGLLLGDVTGDLWSVLSQTISIEALARVRYGRFWSFYHNDAAVEIAIYCDVTLTDEERRKIRDTALDYRDRIYGGAKLFLHMGDWALARMLFRQDVYVFRRLARIDWAPICSYLVAKGYAAVGRNFGVTESAATPDDIWDFVHAHPEKYHPVITLRNI